MLAPCTVLIFSLGLWSVGATSPSVSVTYPDASPANHSVFSNFFGISIELSAIDTYIGESTSSIPQPTLNYLENIHSRATRPLRIRVGGNSLDSSTYVPAQSSLINATGVNATSNDVPTTFGPTLFKVMQAVGNAIGGVQYLFGLSLLDPGDPNIPVLASAAEQELGSSLDAFLLGNEPDLYTAHGNRPYLQNYTVDIYFEEFGNVTGALMNSSYGNLILHMGLGGPSICCQWDLDTVIQQGYISNFGSDLSYISLQHYPQNNCNNTHSFGIDYYLQHNNVVQLASWQTPGIRAALALNKQTIMDEFNSASCGGVPGVSNTFAATLWTADYALQMAAVGYAAAYIHTRERGVTYNLFDSPAPGTGNNWSTLSPYYAFLPVTEALASTSGITVLDMNLNNSAVTNGTVAGYTLYDSETNTPIRLILFNYAEGGTSPASFALPGSSQNTSTKNGEIFVRYLTAPSTTEQTNISWGGNTLAGVGDGKLVSSNIARDQQLSCQGGCTVEVPSPGLAVVWLNASDASIFQSASGAASPIDTPCLPAIIISIVMLWTLGATF